MVVNGKEELVEVKMEIHNTVRGLTAHAGRNEIIAFFKRINPKPKRIIINHGEVSKSLDLASSLYKLNHVETNVPRILETLKLR